MVNSTQTKTAEKRKNFEQFLIGEKFLTAADIVSIHADQTKNQRNFEDSLVSLKFMDEEKLTRARAVFFRLPYIDLRSQTLPKDAMGIIPKQVMENYRLIPFAKQKNLLRVALTEPADLQALEALEFFAQKNQYRIELYLTSKTSFADALRRSRNITTEVGEAIAVIQEKQKLEDEKAKPKIQAIPTKAVGSEPPISQIVDVIIKHAITARASDIHIEPQENDLRIRYRVDGVLHSSLVVPKIVHPAIVSRIKILSNLKIDEQRLPQDGRFHMDVDNHSIDFRVSTLPTVNGEKVVLRILDKSGGVPTLEQLGIDGMKLDRLKENITKAHGMLLVTGPTGSGKSTTLYAVLNIINKIGVNIVTLEDPVEYFIPGVNQSQINPDIGLTFASGLRSILRQDPNVIMVGEIRDKETAELAVHSSLTGHLVFSTLHTNDAIGAVPRLIDMGVEPFLLTASVNAIMAQRLVRRVCSSCRKQIDLPKEVEKMIRTELAGIPEKESKDIDLDKIKIFAGKGCKVCGNTGYQGRVAIVELFPLSEKITAMVLDRESTIKVRDQARAEGMISLRQDGLIKVLKGLTTIEEVIRVTKE